MIKFIDLFSGVGGFHLALKNKANCVFACEWDKYARITYEANFKNELIDNDAQFAQDITKINYNDIPDFDILCAGFPCQPFSVAGKQLGFTHQTQGTLFFNIIEIIHLKQPKVVFLENVKNLTTHDKGNTFNVILKSLTNEGYFIHHKILNTKNHANIAQNRERIFIVAFKNKNHYDKFEFPKEVYLTSSIFDCLEHKKVDTKFYLTNKKSIPIQKILEQVKNKNSIYQYRRYYIRENKNNVCPTLTANMGTGGHNVPFILDNWGVRKLTPRECFNFQGFPKNFVLPQNVPNSSLYKQAGNSITVSVVEKIANKILIALK